MSDDNTQTRGFGALAFAAIPWVLAIAASGWLSFYLGVHRARTELSLEDRMATYVGAAERPKKKIQLEVQAEPGVHGCVVITRADFTGSNLVAYAENRCEESALSYFYWGWRAVSPDGTVLVEHELVTCPTPRLRGEKVECDFGKHLFDPDEIDDRVAKIILWTHAG